MRGEPECTKTRESSSTCMIPILGYNDEDKLHVDTMHVLCTDFYMRFGNSNNNTALVIYISIL